MSQCNPCIYCTPVLIDKNQLEAGVHRIPRAPRTRSFNNNNKIRNLTWPFSTKFPLGGVAGGIFRNHI